MKVDSKYDHQANADAWALIDQEANNPKSINMSETDSCDQCLEKYCGECCDACVECCCGCVQSYNELSTCQKVACCVCPIFFCFIGFGGKGGLSSGVTGSTGASSYLYSYDANHKRVPVHYGGVTTYTYVVK